MGCLTYAFDPYSVSQCDVIRPASQCCSIGPSHRREQHTESLYHSLGMWSATRTFRRMQDRRTSKVSRMKSSTSIQAEHRTSVCHHSLISLNGIEYLLTAMYNQDIFCGNNALVLTNLAPNETGVHVRRQHLLGRRRARAQGVSAPKVLSSRRRSIARDIRTIRGSHRLEQFAPGHLDEIKLGLEGVDGHRRAEHGR